MASKKEIVDSNAIPKPFPVMPFSAAVKYDGMVYLSGNIGMDPETHKIVEGSVQDRTVCRDMRSDRDGSLMRRAETNHEDYYKCVERLRI